MVLPDVEEHVVLYGLRVSSALPLYQHRTAAGDDERADVRVRVGEPLTSPPVPLRGSVVLDLTTDRQLYTATRLEDGGYVLRFHGTCDFLIAPDLREVTIQMAQGADPELAGVLVSGTLLSFILAMRGDPVLHASAVQVHDEAIAFVGASGMGKSTMATLLCADGAKLITDDVLRLELQDVGQPRCRLGATELRLRKAAGELSARFSNEPNGRVTGDARHALRAAGATTDRLPLSAIVIPVPDHTAERRAVEVVRLDRMEALLALVRFPRLVGWQDPVVMDRHFHELNEVVARVPVYVARLPWGPPFPPDVATGLLAEIHPSLTPA